MVDNNYLYIALKKSLSGVSYKHKRCVTALGLSGKLHKKVKILANPTNVGIIKKVSYLLNVTEV